MNSKKLLTLSATLLMALTVASCKKDPKPSSSSSSEAPTSEVSSSPVDTSSAPSVDTSSSPVDTSSSSPVDTSSSTTDTDEALWTAWAESVWDLYKEKNNTQVTGSFDVITVATTRDDNGDAYQAKVHFALEVTSGTTDAIKLNDKDDTHKTVYIGYYDGKVAEETTTKITISIEYEGNTRTINDILSNDKGILTFTTPVLAIDNHAAWAEWDSSDETKKDRIYNIRGTVIDVIDPTSNSGSKGSFYMVDSEGYGYYVYKPEGESPVAGDEVIVTGKRSDYSGQEEFGKGATFTVTKKGVDTSTIAFKNGTADFAAAKSPNINDENLGAKYQNIPVTLEGCVPMGLTGNGYYTFKVGSGSAVFTLYDTYYFLTDEQREAYKKVYNDAMASGHTLTISGICVSYSNQYQIYGSSLKADAVVTQGAEMTPDQKVAVVENAILGGLEETYDTETTLNFALPAYATVTYEVKNADPTVAVSEGKLVVTPTNKDVVNTVTVSVDAGGETPTTFDITIVTEDNSVTKYTGRFDYTTFVVGSTETTAKVTSKKDPTQTENITFTHSAIIDNAAHKEFNLAKETGFMTMTAPEGYTIAKVELKTYHDNLVVYGGTDATGTALERTNEVTSGRDYTYTVEVNGASVYIANGSTQYDASVYYVDVTLTKPNTGEDTEAVVYSTGFETSEGFTTGNVYNDPTLKACGTEGNGANWEVAMGTPTTTGKLSGDVSLQMRAYKDNSNYGVLKSTKAFENVTSLTFIACHTEFAAKLKVSVSTTGEDGSWTEKGTVELTTASAAYKVVLSETGENLYIKFEVVYDVAPTKTSRVTIDDLSIKGPAAEANI